MRILILFLLPGCAALQYRHDLPPTSVTIPAPAAEVHTKIIRAVAEWGWKIELNDRDTRMVQAFDPNQQPGFFMYWLRYHFTYDQAGPETILNVRAQIIANDGQDYSGGGSTAPAKEAERLVAEKIKEACQ